MAARNEELSERKPAAPLNSAQKAAIERNRQKALLRRQRRQASQPYMKDKSQSQKSAKQDLADTGGGFLIDDEDEHQKVTKIVHPPGALLLQSDYMFCEKCGKHFADSYIQTHFDYNICNVCRDADETEQFQLITKSRAKEQFLLKDVDIDKREPTLKFILKQNPHNGTWGSMKLYLHCQIEARAMEVWGSEEAMDDERTKRDENKQKIKQKKFDKKVKELRKTVRSSLFKKDLSGHEHEYTAEVYNEDDDNYSKTCEQCGHVIMYEKM